MLRTGGGRRETRPPSVKSSRDEGQDESLKSREGIGQVDGWNKDKRTTKGREKAAQSVGIKGKPGRNGHTQGSPKQGVRNR